MSTFASSQQRATADFFDRFEQPESDDQAAVDDWLEALLADDGCIIQKTL